MRLSVSDAETIFFFIASRADRGFWNISIKPQFCMNQNHPVQPTFYSFLVVAVNPVIHARCTHIADRTTHKHIQHIHSSRTRTHAASRMKWQIWDEKSICKPILDWSCKPSAIRFVKSRLQRAWCLISLAHIRTRTVIDLLVTSLFLSAEPRSVCCGRVRSVVYSSAVAYSTTQMQICRIHNEHIHEHRHEECDVSKNLLIFDRLILILLFNTVGWHQSFGFQPFQFFFLRTHSRHSREEKNVI